MNNLFMRLREEVIAMCIDRKTEILDAFMRLVERFGFDKTTMLDVAKEAGISVGVIYKDFKNKEDLVDICIQRMIQQFSFHADQILQQDLPSEQLLHDLMINMFQNIRQLSMENRGFWQYLHGECLKYFRKYGPFQDYDPTGIIKRIEWIMAKGLEDGCFEIEDIPKTAILFMCAFKGLFSDLLFINKNLDDVLQNAEAMFAFLSRAIKAR
jgi:AcrR family transcriptional regulator